MSTERVEQIISKEALEAFDLLRGKVDENVAALEKLISTGVSVNKMFGTSKTFTEFNNGLERTNQNQLEVKQTAEQLSAATAKETQAMLDAARAVREKAAAEQASAKANQEGVKGQRDLDKALAEGTIERQKYNAELKAEINLQNAAAGSVQAARAAVKVLTAEREKQNLTSEQGRIKAAELNKEIDKQNEFIRANVSQLEKQKINIGNYSGALGILEQGLADVNMKMDQLAKEGKQDSDVFRTLQAEAAKLSEVVGSQANGFVSMRQEIKANEIAIENLIKTYGKDSEIVQKLINENGQLRDSFGDLQEQQKTLGSDTFAFDALLSGAQALVGMYSAAQGAAALFGDENEDLQKTFIKLQAAMAIVQGVQAVVNSLQSQGALIQGIYAVRSFVAATAQKAFAFATSGATAAAKAFNTALLVGGIGLAIGIIAALADAMGAFDDNTKDATESVEDLNKQIEYQNKLLKDRQESTDFSNKLEIERAKQRGASEKEITNITIKGMRERMQANIDEVKEYESKLDQLSFADKDYSKKYNRFQDEIDARNRENIQITRDIRLTEEQDRTKAFEKSKASAKKNAEENKKQLEDDLRAQFDLKKFYAEQELKGFRTTADEVANPINARIEAEQKALETETKIIEAQRQSELVKEKLTQHQRALINAKANQEIIDARMESGKRLVEIYTSDAAALQESIANMNATLAAGDEGARAKRISFLEGTLNDELATIQAHANEELKIQLDRYTKGKIDEEKYQNEKLKIQAAAQRKAILANIKYYEDLIRLANLTPEAEKDALQKLQDFKQQLYDADVAAAENANEKKKTSNEKLNKTLEKQLQTYKSIAENVAGTVTELVSIGFDRQSALVDGQINQLEKQKEKDIEVANQTILNAQERAAAIQVIEARAEAQKEALERKKRQIESQRARFEKAANMARIIGDTAVAVVTTLGDKTIVPGFLRIPLAVTIGALGLAQLARVAATPIPAYAEGTANHPGGVALVGDAHKSELIVTKEGKLMTTPASPTLMDIPAGAMVLPDARLAMQDHITAGINSSPQLADNRNYMNAMLARMEQDGAKTRRAIKEKTENHFYPTKNGWEIIKNNAGNLQKYLNRNLK